MIEIGSARSRSKSGALIVGRADIQRETRLMQSYFQKMTFIIFFTTIQSKDLIFVNHFPKKRMN